MQVTRIFYFDAAHHLVSYHGKCERMHGHRYALHVSLQGPLDAEGMVFDFVELKRIVQQEILAYVDHSDLNALLPQPSAENIALWCWNKLHPFFQQQVRLCEIQVWETPHCGALYRGE
ncbi:MAG TPA: 6-carboxytetrahydropterin synthase [Thermotogota bacterium]|nr:6-carboxytetrahydropterin synthase [Thermotogota bacterium]HRW92463.1 6-carboxytetrahydropterin synthase [Thermotogota bacterium]